MVLNQLNSNQMKYFHFITKELCWTELCEIFRECITWSTWAWQSRLIKTVKQSVELEIDNILYIKIFNVKYMRSWIIISAILIMKLKKSIFGNTTTVNEEHISYVSQKKINIIALFLRAAKLIYIAENFHPCNSIEFY